MRVLLINPPSRSHNMLPTPLPIEVEKEKGFCPPLGLLYVAAHLLKHTSHQVEVLDAEALEIEYHEVEEAIERLKPDVVGIQAFTFTLIDVLLTAKLVKKWKRDTPVVIGGPHVWLYPFETMAFEEVDFLIRGEGEVAFTLLMEELERGRGHFDAIKGLAYKNGNEVKLNDSQALIEDLDSLPFPARHLVPIHKYRSIVTKRNPITTLITSRGCPHKCLYCDRPHLGKRFRPRSPINVVDEMEECIKMGIKEFLIYDDNFTFQKGRVMDICDEIIRRRLDIGWDIRARVDSVSLDLLKKLKEAGCERIYFGVESGSQRILDILRKGTTIQEIKDAFSMCNKAGISTLAYFMFGSPGETMEDISASLSLAKELKPDYVHFSVTTPYPGTDLYKRGLESGLYQEDYWLSFARNPTPGFIPKLYEEHFTRDQLLEILKKAYKDFYLNPFYILQSFLKLKSFEQFKRKVHAGLRILLMRK